MDTLNRSTAHSRDPFEPTGALTVRSPRDESQVIASVPEWFDYAPPLGGVRHWKDGRSAKEVAKAWCSATGICVPKNLLDLIRADPSTATFEAATAIPECPTHLRGERGGRRKHDVVIFGRAGNQAVLVGVEAKTDESFDELISERIDKAQRLLAKGKPTGQLDRIQRLSLGVFGRPAVREDVTLDAELGALPYQLLAGVAGTVIEADDRRADTAIFVVHAFHSDALNADAVMQNLAAFQSFVAAIASQPVVVREGVLYGPFTLPGGGGVPASKLLIGMTTSSLELQSRPARTAMPTRGAGHEEPSG
jgi:hypothetical protein